MKKNDFKKLKLKSLGVNDNKIDKYIVEVETIDGGKGVIDLDFTEYEEVAYLDIEKNNDSELLDDFWKNLNTMCGILNYIRDLGAEVDEKIKGEMK